MSPAEKLTYMAVCRIPGCGYYISRGPLHIPVIGGPPVPGLVALAEKMGEHLATAHPIEHARLAQAIQFFMGYMTLSIFSLEDPRLLQEYHYHRSVFHQITKRYSVTDEEIAERLAALEFEPEDEQELSELIRDFRDYICEQAKYAPDTSEPSLIKP